MLLESKDEELITTALGPQNLKTINDVEAACILYLQAPHEGEEVNDIQKALIKLAVLVVKGWVPVASDQYDSSLFSRGIRAALEKDCPPKQIEAAIVQCCVYAGGPNTINALKVYRSIVPSTNAPADPPAGTKTGDETLSIIFGEQIAAATREGLNRMSPLFAKTAIGWAFGEVINRTDLLPLLEREMITVGLLAAQGNIAQLQAHIHGAKHVGCNESMIAEIIHVTCATFVEYATSLRPESPVLGAVNDRASNPSQQPSRTLFRSMGVQTEPSMMAKTPKTTTKFCCIC